MSSRSSSDDLFGLGDGEHRQRGAPSPARRSARPGAGAVTARAGPVYASGRYSVNVLPWPGTLTSRISPPSSVASSRLIARPRPVPPYLRLVPASACWNASKISRCFSGAMPMPVSDTSIATALGAKRSTG